MGLGARVVFGLIAVAASAVGLFYAARVPTEAPLYAAAEAGQLIRALYGPALAARPELFPELANRYELLYGLIVRAVTYATRDLLPWLRVGGALAYLGGLVLAFLSVRRVLKPHASAWLLLLALAYPYYRFAASVTPSGWQVGLVGLCLLLTARLYERRPIVHAAAAGAAAGLAATLSPQGLALAAGLALLAIADLALGRRRLDVFAGRLATTAAALVITANLVRLACNQPADAPLSFFVDPRYLLPVHAPASGARAMVAMTAATLALAAVPLLTGLMRVEMRWRWMRTRGGFRLEPLEAAFLLLAAAAIANLAATAWLAAADAADPTRLWGRRVESFVPLLWIAAAPFVGEFERGAGRWWRLAVGGVAAAGLAALVACLLAGAQARAWDDAALAALTRGDGATFLLGAAAIAATAAVTALTPWPVVRSWAACFAALGLISTAADAAWLKAASADRAAFDTEARMAEAFVARRPDAVAVAAGDAGRARLLYWRLRARPEAVVIGPHATAGSRLATADLLVAHRSAYPRQGWRPLLSGREVTVFARERTAEVLGRSRETAKSAQDHRAAAVATDRLRTE